MIYATLGSNLGLPDKPRRDRMIDAMRADAEQFRNVFE